MFPHKREWYEQNNSKPSKPKMKIDAEALSKQMRRSSKPNESNEVIKLRNELKAVKKEAKTAEKSAKQYKNELKTLQSTHNQMVQDVKDLKRRNYEQTQLIENIEEGKQPLLNKISSLEEEISQLNKQLDQVGESALIIELEDLKKKFSVSTQQNINLRRDNLDLKSKNHSLIVEIKNLKSMERDSMLSEQLLSYKKAFNSTRTELESFKAKCRDLESKVGNYGHLEVQDLIKLLDERLSINTLDDFTDFGKLFGKWSDLKTLAKARPNLKYVEQIKPMYQMIEDVVAERRQNEAPPEILGFVKEDGFKLVFEDLEGERYELLDGEDLEVDQPVTVVINNDKACVVKSHKTTYKIRKAPVLRKVKMKRDKIKRTYDNIGNFKVLVVGSRNKRTYLDRLRAHGLDPIWHDPFEDGIAKLRGHFTWADVVLICTDHISHTTTDVIDKTHEKVVQVPDDNADTIVEYVRTKAEQLNLVTV